MIDERLVIEWLEHRALVFEREASSCRDDRRFELAAVLETRANETRLIAHTIRERQGWTTRAWREG